MSTLAELLACAVGSLIVYCAIDIKFGEEVVRWTWTHLYLLLLG